MASDHEMTLWLLYFGILVRTTGAAGCYYEPLLCRHCDRDGHRGVQAVCNDNSRLKIIPPNLPDNLTKLSADRNAIHHLAAKSALSRYTMLKSLELAYNHMVKIDNFTFVKQGLLIQLSLKVNEIEAINEKTFFGLRFLEVLDLSTNKIETLAPGVFKVLASLITLKLGQNRIKTIPTGTFDRLNNMQALHLNDNKIKVMEKGCLGNLMSLRKLLLDNNGLEHIHDEVFSCAPMIHSLKLNNNKLSSVPKAIRPLEFLRNLSLSVNSISLIESDAFFGLRRLEFLDLSNCNISTIVTGALQHITAQARTFTLYLNQNPLHCDCKLGWLRQWSSSFHSLSINETLCNSPSSLYMKVFSSVDLPKFVCTCDACAKDFNCAGANCSCKKDWVGKSCDSICQSRNISSEACIYFNGTCFCVNATARPQLSNRFHNCSFNMTTRICSENADMKSTGSRLDCSCDEGFTGDGVQCDDIDECANASSHKCHKKAVCINTMGSNHCQCRDGYEDGVENTPGLLCLDKNECAKKEKACHVNSQCYNIEGSYDCRCREGYKGDGKSDCLPEPAKPVNLSVIVLHATRARITWSMASFSHVAWYRVEYKDVKANEDWGQEGETIRAPNVSSALLKGLKPGVTYRARVGAFSYQNISRYSERARFSVPRGTSGREAGQEYTVIIIAVSAAIIFLVLVVCVTLHQRSKKIRGIQGRPDTLNTMADLIELRTRPRASRGAVELGSSTKGPTLLSFGDVMSRSHEDRWEVSRDRLQIGRQVGEGQFGLVFEGMLVTGEETTKVAIKTLKYNSDSFDYKDLIQEMEMMKEIGQHPNVVTFIGACTTAGPLYIITEYIAGGNLLDYLRSSRCSNDSYVNVVSTLSSRDLLIITLDVARGMSHVAKKKFVHRDLAARNVLLTETHIAKVADFGLARDVYTEGKYVKTGGGRVPVKWMAPESIEYQLYTTKSDVWSFGVLLWEIMTIGSMPYPCIPYNLLLRKLLSGYRMEKPLMCSDEMYEMMRACWHLEPEKRPTFDKLCDILIDMLSASPRAYVNVAESTEELRVSEPDIVQSVV